MPEPKTLGNPRSRLQRFYAMMQRWADAGWSGSVVFGWALVQSTFFPGLADAAFLPLAIARPKRAYRLALFATVGMLIGSLLLYKFGDSVVSLVEGRLADITGITAAELDEYKDSLKKWGAWAVFVSTISPLSTKLTSIASGMVGVPWPQFVGALLAGRLLRTFGMAWLIWRGGAGAVERWIERRAA